MFNKDSIAKLILRLSLGFLILFHGVAKIIDPSSIEFFGGRLVEFSIPSLLAYGVYLGEVIAPLMLIIGFYTRTAAFLIAVNMIFAIMLFHAHNLLELNQYGGWELELQGFYFLTAIIIFLQGSGKYAVRQS